MLILFGDPLLQAIDKFFIAIAKDFGLAKNIPFSYQLILLYVGLYFIWGVVLGVWISGLPKRLTAQATSIRAAFASLPPSPAGAQTSPHKKKKRWLWPFLLVFILAIFIFSNDIQDYNKVTYVLLRTTAVLILIFMVLNPLVKWLLQRWFSTRDGQSHKAMQSLLELQPEMRSLLRPSWQLAKTQKGIRRYPAFVINLLVLTLHPLQDGPTDIHSQPAGTQR